MDIFGVLSMIGGLALFLYGMHVMGDGLSRASGGRLEVVLEKMTNTPIKAVLLGAGVTAVIQSSSATTVMVVGFVNSGIMKLSQAVGIIMGANIGTTITSWILSLSGIESSNIFVKLLKPTSFSPILALIGVVFLLFTKKEKKHDVGMILIGFAVLMYGMEAMSDAVKPLADVPAFTSTLTMFSNPILGMIAGAVLTAIIQSSSASVGILQALCKTGAVSYATAIPIIMGQNIGTCVTAIISSIGAKKNAKKAALVHLYFNLIGTIVFMVVFYAINAFVKFSFLGKSTNAAGIAIVHSVFNVCATLALLPFAKGLEKLANLTIKDGEDDQEAERANLLAVLDSRFLDKPGFAIEQSKKAAQMMAEKAKESFCLSMELLTQYDEKKAEEVVKLENIVDQYEDELGKYLVKLSGHDLSDRDSHTLSKLLHCIGDFERISDHAVNVMECAEKMHEKDLFFSEKAMAELTVFHAALRTIVEEAVSVFDSENLEGAIRIEALEEHIDALQSEIKKRHVKRLRKGKCTIELGFILSDVITFYERVADHCSNIAIDVLQTKDEEIEAHEIKEEIKEDNPLFREYFAQYVYEFALPEKVRNSSDEDETTRKKTAEKRDIERKTVEKKTSERKEVNKNIPQGSGKKDVKERRVEKKKNAQKSNVEKKKN